MVTPQRPALPPVGCALFSPSWTPPAAAPPAPRHVTVGKEVVRGGGAVAVTPSTPLAAVRSLVSGSPAGGHARACESPSLGAAVREEDVLGSFAENSLCVGRLVVIYVIVDTFALGVANFVGCVGNSEAVVPGFLTSVFSRP